MQNKTETAVATASQSPVVKCAHCDSDNTIGPYEMDGIANGRYQRRGLFWVTCRDCNRSQRA